MPYTTHTHTYTHAHIHINIPFLVGLFVW